MMKDSTQFDLEDLNLKTLYIFLALDCCFFFHGKSIQHFLV